MLSIVLPLYDRQHLGWAALASILDQECDRERYEVVIVLDSKSSQEVAADEAARKLVDQCNIVEFEGDLEDWENRVRIYRCGAEHAVGEHLFFMEGHTILCPGAISMLLNHLQSFPEVVSASSYPLCGSVSSVGKIIDRNQGRLAHSRSTPFAFGGQSVINRRIFLELVEFAEPASLYGEHVINNLLRKRDLAVGQLSAPICTHYNDISRKRFCQLLYFMGELRLRLSHGGQFIDNLGYMSGLLTGLGQPWLARLVYPIAGSFGKILLALDVMLADWGWRMPPRLEGRCLGLLHLAGFCQSATRNTGN